LPLLALRPVQAQTFSVIHAFTGQGDGADPIAALTIDNTGVLYGTTYLGGGVIGRDCMPRTQACRVVFQMKRHAGGWVLSPLYAFTGRNDGISPAAPVVFGPGGLLYGSTYYGGNIGVQDCDFGGCGVVFTMRPQATACHTAICSWMEN